MQGELKGPQQHGKQMGFLTANNQCHCQKFLVLGPLRRIWLYPWPPVVPEAMHEPGWKPWKGAMFLAQKAHQGSETKMRKLLAGGEENRVFQQGVINLTSRQIIDWFFTILAPLTLDCLRPPRVLGPGERVKVWKEGGKVFHLRLLKEDLITILGGWSKIDLPDWPWRLRPPGYTRGYKKKEENVYSIDS